MSDPKLDFNKALLRDDLALDRTILANERTILAYARTALFLLITGASLVDLFELNAAMKAAGYLLSALAVAIMVMGAVSFVRMRRKVRNLRNATLGQVGSRHAIEEDD